MEPTGLPEDQYQPAASVLRGAHCAWLDEWWFAQKRSDDATADAAIKKLEAAARWPAVRPGAVADGLDRDFRLHARAIAAGRGDKQVYDQMMDCISYP